MNVEVDTFITVLAWYEAMITWVTVVCAVNLSVSRSVITKK